MSGARVRGHDVGPTPALAADARTRAFYEEYAEVYAAATRDADLGDLWSRFEGLVGPGAIVADLGCGSGRDLRRFASAGLTSIGLDRSFALCRIAARFSDCRTVAGDVRSLPFRSGIFDGAWIAAVLLHLPIQELAIAMREIGRVLRPGGIAMVSLKDGAGSSEDEQGRFTYLYDETAILPVFARTGFRTEDTVRTIERRGQAEVCWVAYLLRSTDTTLPDVVGGSLRPR